MMIRCAFVVVLLMMAMGVGGSRAWAHGEAGGVCDPEWMEGFGAEGLDGIGVYAMAEFDDGTGPALYVGGEFSTAGGMLAGNIARWDGRAWSPLGSGLSGPLVPQLHALVVFDDGTGPALYAGGEFTLAGGVTVNYIAKWDGSHWSALEDTGGVGVNGLVFALTVFDNGTGPALYAGGGFTLAGGVAIDSGVARWDGSAWSALGSPDSDGVGEDTFQIVRALAVYEDGRGTALYAGGWFEAVGGETVNNIARWDGTAWSALEGPNGTGVEGFGFSQRINALAVFDDGGGPALYVGGDFYSAGGVGVANIARWDGSVWSALDSGSGLLGLFGQVRALSVFDDGEGPDLYAGGNFNFAGAGVEVNRIARWDGSDWSALVGPDGVGVSGGWVNALTVFDDGTNPALYAGGGFAMAGGIAANRIAKWRGCAIAPVPCVGDLNGDGVVDAGDLGVLLGAFGTSDAGDLNGDGVTDADDLGILLGVFGSVCE